MLKLALGQLRHRFARYLSLFFAVFAAVALTTGTVAIVQSLQSTVGGLFDKPYAGVAQVAQVRSSEPLTIPEGAVLEQQTSVSVKVDGNLYDQVTARSIAEGPLQWRAIQEGHLPHGPGEIAVSDDTPLGTVYQLKSGPVTVVGRVEQSAQEQLNGARTLFADPATINEWAGTTTVGELRSSKPIERQQGITDITSAQKHTQKLADKYLAKRGQYFLLLSAFMAVVAVVAMLVIFSSYSVIAAERRREYALLRAVGASAPQLQGSAVLEALILGGIAGVLGAPAGMWAAKWAGTNAGRFGIRVPLTDVSIDPLWAVAIALAGIAVCVLSALPAASGAIRSPLVSSLSASAPRATLWGPVVLVVGAALVGGGWWYMPRANGIIEAIGIAGLIVFGAVLLLAVVLPWLIFAISRLLSALPSLQLGMAFVGRQRLRAGALVAIVLAGSALVGAVLSGQQRIESHLLSTATNKGAVDVAVRALDNTAEQELIDALLATPGVAAGVAPTALPVSFGGASDSALALLDTEGVPVLRGPVTGARPGELVLGTNSPLRSTLSDGQQATISVRGLEHDLTVRYNDGLETFIDPVTTPMLPAVVRPGVDTRMPQPFVLLRLEGDTDQKADSPVLKDLRRVAAGSAEEVSFQEAFSARQDIADMTARVLTLSTLMSIVALLVALVGAVNTVILMVRERRQDLSLLSAIGVGSAGRFTMLAVELIVLVIPASAVGWLLGGWLGDWVAGVVV